MEVIKVFSNIFSVAMLETISLYHVFLYISRKKYSSERYNLNFGLTCLFSSLYVIYNTFFNGSARYGTFLQDCSALFVTSIILLTIIFYIRFIYDVYPLNSEEKRMYRIPVYLLIIAMINSMPSVIYGYQFYLDKTRVLMTPFVAGAMFFLIGYTAYLSFSKKLIKNKVLFLITINFCTLIIFLSLERIFVIFNLGTVYIKNNYLFLPFQAIIFSYALILKFNGEYIRLESAENQNKEYAEELELQVIERTKELEEANEKVHMILDNLAHEIGTPLFQMQLYASRYSKLNNVGEDFLFLQNAIGKISRDMKNFRENLKVKNGIYDYDILNVFNLSELILEKCELYDASAMWNKLFLIVDVDEDIYILSQMQQEYSRYLIIWQIMQ